MTFKLKKLASLCLSLCMITGVGFATGCGSTENSESSSASASVEKSYTFSVVDDNGEGVLGAKIVVKNDGQVVKELLTDSTGCVTATLQVGSIVSVTDLPSGYACEGEQKLGALVTEIEFKLVKSYISPTKGDGGPYSRYEIKLPENSLGKELDEGLYLVEISEANEEVFFSFDPSRTGMYRITSLGELDAKLNAYAATSQTLYRQEDKDSDDISETDKNFQHLFEVTPTYFYRYEDANRDGELTEDEKVENTEHRYTFALTLNDGAVGSYAFKIEYVSEDWITPEVEYVTVNKEPSIQIAQFTAPEGKTLVEAPYNYYDDLVFNEEDGYYHANGKDGPIAVVNLLGKQDRFLNGNTLSAIAEEHPPVFTFVTETKYDENGYCIKIVKTNYSNLVLNDYGSKADENGMYPLTKDLYEFFYWYIVKAGNSININLPSDLDTSVQVENWAAECMAAVWLYCDEDEIPKQEVVVVPDGSYDNPYVIEELGTYGYSLTNQSGATNYDSDEYHTFVAPQAGNLKIVTQNANANIEIVNKTTNEKVTIKGEGETTIAVSEGDVLYFHIVVVGTQGYDTVSLHLSYANI